MTNVYERRALEAERQALAARTPEEREAHEQVARVWRELAERRKAKDKPRPDDA